MKFRQRNWMEETISLYILVYEESIYFIVFFIPSYSCFILLLNLRLTRLWNELDSI